LVTVGADTKVAHSLVAHGVVATLLGSRDTPDGLKLLRRLLAYSQRARDQVILLEGGVSHLLALCQEPVFRFDGAQCLLNLASDATSRRALCQYRCKLLEAGLDDVVVLMARDPHTAALLVRERKLPHLKLV
jgi:hypothetical protein